VITPFTLMGAMAPVTLAGALAQQTAEGLGIIALCQLLRVGAPCVLGGFTSNVDMRSGSPAFGTPEYLHAVFASAQIGRRLRIPVRTSAVNASPTVDAQSSFESWTEAGAHDATARATAIWKKVLADYVPPPLDPAVSAAIAAYVATRKGALEGTSPA